MRCLLLGHLGDTWGYQTTALITWKRPSHLGSKPQTLGPPNIAIVTLGINLHETRLSRLNHGENSCKFVQLKSTCNPRIPWDQILKSHNFWANCFGTAGTPYLAPPLEMPARLLVPSAPTPGTFWHFLALWHQPETAWSIISLRTTIPCGFGSCRLGPGSIMRHVRIQHIARFRCQTIQSWLKALMMFSDFCCFPIFPGFHCFFFHVKIISCASRISMQLFTSCASSRLRSWSSACQGWATFFFQRF